MNARRSHGVFVDWITATERHPRGGLPIIVNGLVVRHNRDGVVLHERVVAASLAGSFASSVQVSCDGTRVYLHGNAGRFSREDNLFNHDWTGTVAAANRILLGVGLPPFTAARGVSADGFPLGARVHRLDLTANYSTGSSAQARAVIRWMGAQSLARMKRGQVGDESVWWVNTRHMFKAYIKGLEMVKHGRGKDEFAVDWCEREGIVRVEVELKERLLSDLGLVEFASVSQTKLEEVFEDQTELLRRVDRTDEPDILAAVPRGSRAYAAAWLGGQDLAGMMSRATLYRHARVLRAFGMDIFQARNVSTFPLVVRVVDLKPVAVPDWYDLSQSPPLKIVNGGEV